jgi:hypothetical protein
MNRPGPLHLESSQLHQSRTLSHNIEQYKTAEADKASFSNIRFIDKNHQQFLVVNLYYQGISDCKLFQEQFPEVTT